MADSLTKESYVTYATNAETMVIIHFGDAIAAIEDSKKLQINTIVIMQDGDSPSFLIHRKIQTEKWGILLTENRGCPRH